jgi:hypothetical protein
MELPLLRLGLLGFDQAQTDAANTRVQSATTAVSRWEVVSFEDADLWLINSPSVSLGGHGGLHINNANGTHLPLTIYPEQSSRPVAFTQPLPPNIDAVLSLDLEDTYECSQGLKSFTNSLMGLCTHFALGEQIATRQSSLVMGVYHLQFEGRQVATVDLARWLVSLQPHVKPIELSLASWRHRPGEASHFSVGAEVLSLERLMWVYASRTQTTSLPPGYLTQAIHLRRRSVLPQSWLHDDHMNLIGQLSQQPCTMAMLARQTRLPLKRLGACLSALYYSGTITTDPSQVVRGDKRIPSNASPTLASESTEPSGMSLQSGQSVFETHSFDSTHA